LFKGLFIYVTIQAYEERRNLCFCFESLCEFWFQTDSACRDPRNDLQLLKDLKKYEKLNQALSKIAIKEFLGRTRRYCIYQHSWVFSATSVPSEFVERNVEIWEEDEVYCKISGETVRAVSDVAERGAALMEEYDK
jgi:hypothetical protein